MSTSETSSSASVRRGRLRYGDGDTSSTVDSGETSSSVSGSGGSLRKRRRGGGSSKGSKGGGGEPYLTPHEVLENSDFDGLDTFERSRLMSPEKPALVNAERVAEEQIIEASDDEKRYLKNAKRNRRNGNDFKKVSFRKRRDTSGSTSTSTLSTGSSSSTEDDNDNGSTGGTTSSYSSSSSRSSSRSRRRGRGRGKGRGKKPSAVRLAGITPHVSFSPKVQIILPGKTANDNRVSMERVPGLERSSDGSDGTLDELPTPRPDSSGRSSSRRQRKGARENDEPSLCCTVS